MESRWERLAATLAERGGVETTVDPKSYPGGTSYSIIIRTADGGIIEVADTWWRKNPDIWTGWQVYVSNRDSIITRTYPKTKARGPVADQVREALATAGGTR